MDPRVREALNVLAEQLARDEATSPSVGELWAKYEAWGKRERRWWKDTQAVHWKHLAHFWQEVKVSAITLATADAYREGRRTQSDCAPATRNHELSSLRACFSWAVKRKFIPFNPLSGLEQERMANTRTVFLEEPAFAQLCAAAPNPMARALFTVAYDTGMRRGELVALRRSQLDLEAQLIRMGDGDVKNGEGRIVPLTDRACDTFRSLPSWSDWVFSLSGGPIGLSTVNDWFRAARDEADLSTKLVFHSLRHSAATLMRRRGVPWPLVKVALGWKTDVAARRYQQYNAADWDQLRTRMNDGISAERKPPQKAPSSRTVAEKAQATS